MLQVLSFIVTLLLIGGLAWWLERKTVADRPLRLAFWLGLGLRLVAGLLLGWFYREGILYGGDTLVYQKTANLLTTVGQASPGAYFRILFFNEFADQDLLKAIPYPTYTNSFFLIKIVSLLNFLTGSNYHLNSLLLSFFSFAGCWVLALQLGRVFTGSRGAALAGLVFFPSVVFWNAGIMKDGLLLSALGFFWASVLQVTYSPGTKTRRAGLLLLLAGVLLWKLKFFLAFFVFALTGSWFGLRWAHQRFAFFRRGPWRWLVFPVLVLAVFFAFSLLHYKFNLPFLLMSLVLNHEHFLQQSAGRPVIALAGLEATLPGVLRHTPEALAGIFFRPFVWEGNNIFYRLAGLENLLLLAGTLGAMVSGWKLRVRQFPGFYLVLLLFVLCLAAAFGLSTPNLGSLNRYRTIFLPFFVFLLLQTPFWQKIYQRIRAKLRQPAP